MTTIGGGVAAEFFADASFPELEDAPDTALEDALDVAAADSSNVVNGSCCSLPSGFPRRRRGRFGSSIGSSSDADLDAAAVFVGSGEAAGLAASGDAGVLVVGAAVGVAVGGLLVDDDVGTVAGFC